MNNDDIFDRGSILDATIPKTPKTLYINLQDFTGEPIKEVCFQFKDEKIIFSLDEILELLKKFRERLDV